MNRLSSLADLARRVREPAFEIVARVQLARAAAMLGDRSVPKEQAAAIAALVEADPVAPASLHDSGSIALLAGDVKLAKRQLARLAAGEASNPAPVVKAARLLLAGEIALAEGRPADAARLQDEALLLRPWFIYSSARAHGPGSARRLAARGRRVESAPPSRARCSGRRSTWIRGSRARTALPRGRTTATRGNQKGRLTMARSQDVYTVLGLMCIDREFRDEFFEHPVATARKLVGSLTVDEQLQIKRIAGTVGLPGDRAQYVRQLTDEFDGVYAMLKCPNFPCPDPDPFDS